MKKNIIHASLFIVTIWVVFIVSRVLPINQFGIIPRSFMGLIGIFTAPFLHSDLNHITNNTVALITFIPIFILVVGKNVIEKLIVLSLVTGLFTWIFAFPGNHIGASGLVFALYGFLISLGFIKKKFILLALSCGLLFFYGYMIVGVFPLQSGVSWESHLLGGVSGVFLARYRS